MTIKRRLKKIEQHLADQQLEGTMKVIFRDPATVESVETSNPNDTIIYFNIPRPNREVSGNV